jgi:PAS domain S-box-containing protein
MLETRRERVEKVWGETEQDKTTVLNHLSELMVFQDLEHRVLWSNKAAGESVGQPSEKLVGRYCYDVWGSGGKACAGCPVEKARETGKPQTSEMTTPDGKILLVKGYPILNASGDVSGLVEMTLEITERKQAEEALRESEAKYKALAEGVPVGIYFNDFSGKLLYGNDKALEIVGYKREELLGKSFLKLKLLDSKGMAKAIKVLALNKMGKATGPDEFALNRKDGTKSIVEISTRITTVGDKKVVLGMVDDITERKRAEEELQEEKNKLQSVIGAMGNSLTIQDRDFNVIYQNEASKLASGDHIGEKCYRVFEGSEAVCDGCPVKKAFNDGKSHTAERRNVLPSGEVVYWENTASPIRDAKGKIGSCLEIGVDITERKKAEEALADEATRHRILIDQSSDGIVIMDENGGVYEANLRFAEMLGYTPEEVRELNVWDWEAEFPREQVAEMIASIGPEGDRFETQHRRKDGTIFDVEISTNGAVCSGQKLIFCVCRDITERKQADKALVEAEEKYKNLVEVASDLIWEVDTQGKYTFISPKIKDILGYEVDEVVGKKRTLDFTPKEEVKKWLKRFKEVNAKREGFSGFEVLHLHKNGTPVFFEVSGIPYFDSAGDFKGYVGINKDVTERKQMTKALRESQEFSNGLLENSPNPIFVLNPDTSVRYVNPAFEKLTGFKLDAIVGKKAPYPWWLKEESKAMTLGLKNAMVSGGKRSEKVFRKKDGERFCVALNSAPVVYRKKLLYFLISWLDITDRKRAEEEKVELEQKAHLASRLASVGEMASGIAHEINNPLTAVIGFAQLLMDTDLPEEIKEDLVIIHKEAQRAAGVARNLLTFARKHAPSKQPTGVNSIIEGVLALRAYEQNVSNIQISTKLAPELPEVMADYSQLQQVFINLILNAESAMLEANNGGTLTITTQRFNHSVRASFADDGPGIDKENLNRIFDPFFTTKEVGKGTGLGLSVCHGIVAEHGGRIYARSKPGSGATFVVELPINSHEQVEKPNEAAK